METSLVVSSQARGDTLFIEYTFRNHASQPLLAYDGAPGIPPDAEWPALDNQIYISVIDDRVEMKRIAPPPLPGLDMNRIFIPPSSQTLPGRDHKVRFSLKLPLAERSEYTPHFAEAQYQDRVVHKLRLCIGYFLKTDSVQLQPLPANPHAFRVLGIHDEQKLVCADCQQELQVKVRIDDKFQRF